MTPLWKSWLKKKDLTDEEWEKKKKEKEKKRKKQMVDAEAKAKEEKEKQDKIDRERGYPTDDEYNANTCPTCGHNSMDDDPPDHHNYDEYDPDDNGRE